MEKINLNNIKVGDLAVESGNTRLRSVGIGSCVVVCMFDKQTKTGGMIHAMLPKRSEYIQKKIGPENLKPEAKYVDEGIKMLYEKMKSRVKDSSDIKAKIAGGAVMFKALKSKENSIGQRNIEMAKKILDEIGVPLDGEDVGGGVGRSVEFNVANGILNINTKI